MTIQEDEKAEAARKSLDFVQDGMVVGIGTGTTAKYVIEFLAEKVRQGLKIRGIPTSEASAALARSLNIPLTSFEEVDDIDVTIDGADEIGPDLQLIKGGGGALLHEKIVATSSKRLVIVADERKLVKQLGAFPLPVEVIKFAASPVKKHLERLQAKPALRMAPDGQPYRTDEGNFIFDCHFGRIADPQGVATAIKSITGVVEHGLFIGLASIAIVAGGSAPQVITK
jgi:ribose 5-phosphate isomerase A